MDTNRPAKPQALPQLDPPESPRQPPNLSRRETIWIMLGGLKAGFLIAGIMSATMILVVVALRLLWRV
ncbi:hypothetical protein AGMMS49992_01850 [Clostridia bacterium]|nr:hypothetical protein AGMMS49992_01850 [Clostridia bacterium]